MPGSDFALPGFGRDVFSSPCGRTTGPGHQRRTQLICYGLGFFQIRFDFADLISDHAFR